jgi:hypothetical protein
MTDWDLKLKAFLHDPPHKPTVSFLQKRLHEDAARDIIQGFMGLSQAPNSNEIIEWARRMSAAMTRLLAEAAQVSEAAILDEIDRTGHIPVRDPWLGDISRGLYVSLRLGPPARLVRQLLPPQAPQTSQFRFYLVYRSDSDTTRGPPVARDADRRDPICTAGLSGRYPGAQPQSV